MILRQEYEAREREVLAPFAAISSKSRGRKFKEHECEFRSAFQRDRDRIIHSEAFRKLEYKTQVFVNHEGDYYRTRLTHTLEVAQISRGIARTLGLNEDLAEAIALAHDLGHTPFGHAGEYALDELMKDFGGFEHNRQSYRVVTELEFRYVDFRGLNLTFEVLEGIAKHSGEYDKATGKDFEGTGYATLEAQIVNIADEIAYLNHDLDDGLESGLLHFDQLGEVALWKKMLEVSKEAHPKAGKLLLKYQIVRRLIHLFVTDLQTQTRANIEAKKIATLEDVRLRGKELVAFSSGMKKDIGELRKFLFKNLYRHPKVAQMTKTAQLIIEELFNYYLQNTDSLPSFRRDLISKGGDAHRIVCDHIASMTDRQAMAEHAKVHG